MYTYTEPGTYSVKLTATNGHGSDTEISYCYITVFPPTITVVSPNGGEDCPRAPTSPSGGSIPGIWLHGQIEPLNGSTVYGCHLRHTGGKRGDRVSIVPVPPDMPLGTEYGSGSRAPAIRWSAIPVMPFSIVYHSNDYSVRTRGED